MQTPFDAPPRTYKYAIGIDLGTTNSAVAYVEWTGRRRAKSKREIQFFEVPQLVGPGELGHGPVLPSFLYLPGEYDLPEGSLALPWDATKDHIVGVFAREQGAKVPARLVTSAKSWMTHAGVDRTADLLPYGAPREVAQVSPVEAARRYLTHLKEAWNDRMAAGRPSHRFEEQLLILTVPASFDEVARELTVEAARGAGLAHAILLEEPLAALYAWLAQHDPADANLKDGDLLLVCDVGGGTTDYSLVGVRAGGAGEGLRFDRLAVGDHLMLGGDNMDHTLSRHIEAAMTGAPGKLDVQRWNQLVHQCRKAKEDLLGDEEADAVEVSVLGSGGKLIGGTLTGTLTRDDVERLILEGFFPETPLDAPVLTDRRGGLTELGLPYAHDPAITRHLADFWRRSLPFVREKTGRDAPFPDFILFNGGVFTPAMLRRRLHGILGDWFAPVAGDGWTPTELSNPRLDLAVAHGAAYYGLVRLGEGTRIGSGSPRAYFVGVEGEGKVERASEGEEAARRAVCLVPRGAEEGFVGRLDELGFEARTNQPVTFHLFSSSSRSADDPGDLVTLADDEALALPPIRTVLQFGKKNVERLLPVRLSVRLTEVGTLELWCESKETPHRWQLQFDVRTTPAPPDEAAPPEALPFDPAALDAAAAALAEPFAASVAPVLADLWKRLEAILDLPRAEWPIPVLRRLGDALLKMPRDASAYHEAVWFEALGYLLRPGYGDPADEWRMGQVWKVYLRGLHFPKDRDARMAWWSLWRRTGGGLPSDKQAHLYHEARPYIQVKTKTKKPSRLYPRRMDADEKLDAWTALASFERLPSDIRVTLGRLILQKFKDQPKKSELWAIARIGARIPVSGPLDTVVPRTEVAVWLRTLLTMKLPRRTEVGYALAHLGRRTGDRSRDVPEDIWQHLNGWLRKLDAADLLKSLVTDPDPALVHPGIDWLMAEPLPALAPSAHLDPQGITVAT